MINSELKNLFVEEDEIDYDDYDVCFYDDSIEELDFSVRTYNCLRRAGITTVSQLKQMTIVDLKKVRNLGSKSIEEITQKVELFGADNRVPQDVWFPSKFGLK
jgi:DNA-directed RNA polymerase alpha subunit